MRVVFFQFKIFENKIVNILNIRVHFHFRQCAWFARELLVRLLEMIGVQMQVAKGMHKLARAQAGDLGDHHCKQRVAGNVERHAEKQIRAALI